MCDLYAESPDYPCDGGFIQQYSMGNRTMDDSMEISSILNLTFVVVGIVASLYYKRLQALTAEEVDRSVLSTSNYTIMVKNIPTTETEESIREFFDQKGGKRLKINVKRVVLASDIGTYVSLVRRKAVLLDKKTKVKLTDALEKELTEIQDKLSTFDAELVKSKSHQFTGIAFVTLSSQAGIHVLYASLTLFRVQ